MARQRTGKHMGKTTKDSGSWRQDGAGRTARPPPFTDCFPLRRRQTVAAAAVAAETTPLECPCIMLGTQGNNVVVMYLS